MVSHMSVDIEALGFDISEETFNPPSFSIKSESICRCRDIGDHYNQITFNLFSFKAQFGVRAIGPLRYLRE